MTADLHGIRWCRGQGDGTFVFGGLLTADLWPDRFWIDDLDGDSCPDAIAIESIENTFSVIPCVAACR